MVSRKVSNYSSIKQTIKKNMIWILGIILIFVLAGFFPINYSNNTSQNIKTLLEEIEDCPKTHQYKPTGFWYRLPTCITPIAVKYKNSSICDYVGYRDAGERCLAEVTIAIGNITECGKFRNYGSYCKEQILKIN
ncbi:hypothetical protein KAJ38_01985 [Candidatus Pacearchaeota archaeon]|nr:hypothetical protein [Candidatus Pacearchaeota archaeon]